MLRLCYGLNRYSANLDFWICKKIDFKKYYSKMFTTLKSYYEITDSTEKYFTILFEVKSKNYPQKLKLEIRKNKENFVFEESIAFSKYSNIQVILKTLSLENMLKTKIETFLSRKEIRDCFDIEFLIRKGIKLDIEKKLAQKLLVIINSLTKFDYKVKLGSILDETMRDYYIKNGFKLLTLHLQEILK